MTAPKTPISRGADIVHSPDDGGWWVQLWQQALGGSVTKLDTPESPVFPAADKAEAGARKHGSTVFLRDG
jgi:hypothetical protein